eukprot:16307804-Heterocapsa_arctica.AAC.1
MITSQQCSPQRERHLGRQRADGRATTGASPGCSQGTPTPAASARQSANGKRKTPRTSPAA